VVFSFESALSGPAGLLLFFSLLSFMPRSDLTITTVAHQSGSSGSDGSDGSGAIRIGTRGVRQPVFFIFIIVFHVANASRTIEGPKRDPG